MTDKQVLYIGTVYFTTNSELSTQYNQIERKKERKKERKREPIDEIT